MEINTKYRFSKRIIRLNTKTIELTQTGAIDFAVAGTANLETFADVYEVFSMPYLFDSVESYKAVMQDTDYMEKYMSQQTHLVSEFLHGITQEREISMVRRR